LTDGGCVTTWIWRIRRWRSDQQGADATATAVSGTTGAGLSSRSPPPRQHNQHHLHPYAEEEEFVYWWRWHRTTATVVTTTDDNSDNGPESSTSRVVHKETSIIVQQPEQLSGPEPAPPPQDPQKFLFMDYVKKSTLQQIERNKNTCDFWSSQTMVATIGFCTARNNMIIMGRICPRH
jgi:hypothetical protein